MDRSSTLRTAAVAAVLATFAGPLTAQHFARSYEFPDDLETFDVTEASDGELVMVGTFTTGLFPSPTALLQRMDAAGNLIRQVDYRNAQISARATTAMPLSNGDVLVAGSNGASPWLAQAGPDGTLLTQQATSDWVATYESMSLADDGTTWVMGWMTGVPLTELLIGRLNANHEMMGQRRYKFSGVDFYHGQIQALPDGGAMLVATDRAGDGISDLFLARLGSLGEVVWTQSIGGPGAEGWLYAPRLELASNGDVFVCASQDLASGDSEDLWVMRIDLQGQRIWEKAYDLGRDVTSDLVAMDDDGLILCGTSDGDGNDDFAVLRLDASGNVQWAKLIGGDLAENCHSMHSLANGDIALVGTTMTWRTQASEPDGWLVRMGSDGSFTPGSPWIQDATFQVLDINTPVSPASSANTIVDLVVSNTSSITSNRNPAQSAQAVDNAGAWSDLGTGLAGTNGVPYLAGAGNLTAGEYTTVMLAGARAGSFGFLVVGTAQMNAPFGGGTLVPAPTLIHVRPTGPLGFDQLELSWPAGVPAGLDLYLQSAIQDPLAIQGWALSNAVHAVTP